MEATDKNQNILIKHRKCILIFVFIFLFVQSMMVFLYKNKSVAINYINSNSTAAPHATDLVISPLMKLFGGGMTNDDVVPMFLKDEYIEIGHKVMVDIGMFDGKESAQSVMKGHTVFGFEPLPIHIRQIFATFAAFNISDRIKFVNVTNILMEQFDRDLNRLRNYFTKEHALAEYALSDTGHGFLYLFQCAASYEVNVTHMRNMGVWSNLRSVSPTAPTVVLMRVDSIVYHNVFWFKTDTQGFEYDVLRGSVNLFAHYNVELLTMEYWPSEMQHIYGENAIHKLFEFVKTELFLDVCFPIRKDGNKFAFYQHINASQFENISLEIKNQYHRRFWDDMLCVKMQN